MPVAELTDAPYLEELGQMYEGNATAGYTYYRLHIPVFSAGNKALEPEYDLYLDVAGEDYDVGRYYSYGEEEAESAFERRRARRWFRGTDRRDDGGPHDCRRRGSDYGYLLLTADDYYDSENGRQMEIHKPR